MGRQPTLALTTLPPVGYTIDDRGFKYAVTAAAPHTNRAGERSAIITWRGVCAECGAAFLQKTGFRVYGFSRRCDEHKSAMKAARPFGSTGAFGGRQVTPVAINELQDPRLVAALAENERLRALLGPSFHGVSVGRISGARLNPDDHADHSAIALGYGMAAPDAEPETNDEAWSRASEVIGRIEEPGPWGVRVRYKFTDEADEALPDWVYYPDAVAPDSLAHMADAIAAADLMGGVS